MSERKCSNCGSTFEIKYEANPSEGWAYFCSIECWKASGRQHLIPSHVTPLVSLEEAVSDE